MTPLTIPWWDTSKFPWSIELFTLGDRDIGIHSFGFFVAIGFWLGAHMAARKARTDGLDPGVPHRLVGWLILAALVGGRLGHELFYNTEVFFADPSILFDPFGGLSSTGGLLASIGVVVWRVKYVEKKDFWPYADTVVWGLMFGWVFGRIGCFSAHDHPGIESEFFLAVQGMCPAPMGQVDLSRACHDMGLYEAMWAAGCATLFWVLDRKPRPAGFWVAMIALCYGPYRFASDFLRQVDKRWMGLTAAQYFALGLVVVGVGLYLWRKEAPRIRDTKDERLAAQAAAEE